MEQITQFATQHPLLSIAFVVLSILLVYTEIARRMSGFQFIGVNRATELVNRDNALIIDVSSTADFEKAHIPGSESVPVAQLDPNSHKLLKNLNDRPLILVCRAGNSASDAAKKLVKAGIKNVSVLDGGIHNWRQADMPVKSGRK